MSGSVTSAALTGGGLPDELHRYLTDDSLATVWSAVRSRLERNGLTVVGQVTASLDERGADRLGGLLGMSFPAGNVRVRLATLDAALRRSAAAAGLVTVIPQVTGMPLVDRRAANTARQESWAQLWDRLDGLLSDAGLAGAAWAPGYVESVRRSGLLTRAGVIAALSAVEQAVSALAELTAHLATVGANAEPVEAAWELAELASRCTGDAHGLDDGRLAAALVLRAAAVAFDAPVPTSAADRRQLWARLGVTPDLVSGTALVWGLRPAGSSPWAAMMCERAELQLVTHLTVHELRRAAAAGARLADRAQPVHACENPQVLQAAIRTECAGPLVCFAGNPSSAGWLLLRGLLDAGADVRYHGDFDWPGMAIAGRLISVGASPWRLSAKDYTDAVNSVSAESRLMLSGAPVVTRWDEAVSARMLRTGVAVHEESLLPLLLPDVAP